MAGCHLGVDLDWEYPGSEERGGRRDTERNDTTNFVLLVKEMRASFSSSYGISLPLAPDYWYLRCFDAKGMEPYVDFFGFMTYDLHGVWDSDAAHGRRVQGHTDLAEITKDLLPLAYAGMDFRKINMGLGYYGRGYTLQGKWVVHGLLL